MIRTKIIADSIYESDIDNKQHRVTTFELEYPRCILAELNTHRCLVGDTLLHFDLPTGQHKNSGKRVYTMSIKDFYTKWSKGAAKHTVGSINKTIKVDAVEADHVYTAKELANILGYKSPSNIRNLCRLGRLESLNPNKSRVEDFLIRGSAYLKLRESYGLRSFSIKDRLKEMQLRCCNTTTHFIEHTHITDIWEVGQKEVFEVKTKSGKSILATVDHPFYIGNGVYAEVKDLQVGSFVYIESKGKAVKQDSNTYNKHNGQWIQTWIRQNKDSVASRQANKCFDCRKQLPAIFDIHHVIPRHVDPTKSFDLNNVVALCPSCHKKRHEIQDTYNHNGAFLYAKPDEIVSITSKGIQTVYDLSVESSEHNFVANGFIVHNCFSRNSASSRAIPIDRMIELTTDNPVMPMWTLNQKGMSGIAITNDDKIELANAVWLDALSNAVKSVEKLNDLGIHKQNANRLLEPFQHIKTILTGTDFDNFFNLRIAPEAQPEIELLAESMKRDYDNSKPVVLRNNKLHCPYFKNVSVTDITTILTSVALCAQVSYRRENKDPDTVRRIINRLMGCSRIHASPFEHVCMPNVFGFIPRGNLNGYVQLRHKVEDMKTGMDNRMKFTPDSDYYDELIRLGNIIWL